MPSLKDLEKSYEDKPLRTIVLYVLFIVGLGLLVGGIYWVVQVVTLPARTATEVAEKTMDADNVIYNYEWFKEAKEKADAYEVQISQAKLSLTSFEGSLEGAPRTEWGFEDKQEWNRLNSVILGLQNQRASLVADYNAKSKMENRVIFKENALPDTLK